MSKGKQHKTRHDGQREQGEARAHAVPVLSPRRAVALLCAPPGAPSRDVLLVSAIITVSLSVTIVLCGICQWCQRKLVSVPIPTGRWGGE